MTHVEVPALGESVTQATLLSWRKPEGAVVAVDEPICELETDKANVDLPASSAGVLHHLKEEGATVNVGEAIAQIDENSAPAQQPLKGEPPAPPLPPGEDPREGAAPSPSPLKGGGRGEGENTEPGAARSAQPASDKELTLEDYSPAVRRLIQEYQLDPSAIPATGPGERITKEDVETYLAKRKEQAQVAPAIEPKPVAPQPSVLAPPQPHLQPPMLKPPAISAGAAAKMTFDAHGIRREPMSKIRRRIAERLVQAQHTAAILTTINEVDLTEVIALRAKYKERFQEVHGVGLGFMSFFARAVVLALHEIPSLNAFIEGEDIVYHRYVNLGIAVSTERGLTLPVLRNVQDMSFGNIETEIKRLAAAARDGKLSIEELSGGTFSITNGGVFGSLLSTPILTPPQSGILGMHNIQKRPMVIGDKIEIRSMMYLALSYDHRLVDGKDAITFLVRVKQLLEDPARVVLEI